ncbi:DUF4124 domain-containing protein [Halopseudomonas sp.]|jgi:hypothetical protein|uniref:DUF4124 domain-containing protein n=1 Tax=Halopseudomonas sp. TaxID=2901191 RepID=UPI001A4D9BF1|nr:DUF4124 domain-containing protein [Pseudomonas sp.]|tara:strand:- start:2106 stop:2735 length:630 start_codon:yes stop_codon:yes gene_type:complete
MLRPLLCHTLGILLIALAGLAHAQIYKWTDDQGNTIYSDQPHPNSSQVELPPTNTLETNVPQMPASQTGSSSQNSDRQGQLSNGYNTLQITSPGDDEAIRANDGNVTLVINTEPPLSPGHILRASVDGQLRQEAVAGNGQSTQRLTLSELDRGSHDIVAVVTNTRGEEVDRSPGITVHVQRTSVLQPGRTGPNAAPQAPGVPAAGNPAP